MNRFAPLIRATSERLDLPHPARARLLVEMAADLEDLFEHYVAGGASEADAHSRACEHFALSEEALRHLVEVHASPARRLLDKLSERTRAPWERVALISVAAFAAITTLEGTMTTNFFLDASPIIWSVVVLGLAALAIAAGRFHGLYVRGDHSPRRARAGLPTLLAIAVMCPILASFTVVVELLRLAYSVYPTPERAFSGTVMTIARIAPVMITALVVAVVSVVLWYVFSRKAVRIDRAEAEALVAAGALEGGS